MSIEVAGLTKMYGQQRAVDNLSFQLEGGSITGFLGPNGAGKSTTMKMLTGIVIPDEGSAKVCGYDLAEDPIGAQRKTGFLPENNPLYKDMYVREYLNMVAQIHEIQDRKARVDEMVELTGLQREAHKLIGTLSKGYRQRVGLAQAMIHDPDVLILDEPTSGLDPNQLAEIRALIKMLGEKKTVLLSTHIMQEVQAICDRVIVLNLGRKVADAPISSFKTDRVGDRVLTLEIKGAVAEGEFMDIKGVIGVEGLSGQLWRVTYNQSYDIREAVFRKAVERKWVILEMSVEKNNMESIFQELTKVK